MSRRPDDENENVPKRKKVCSVLDSFMRDYESPELPVKSKKPYSRYHEDCAVIRVFKGAHKIEPGYELPDSSVYKHDEAKFKPVRPRGHRGPFELDHDTDLFFRAINSPEYRVIRYSGKGGAGKSFLFKRLFDLVDPNGAYMTAPTTRAALNLGTHGKTIFKAIGFGLFTDPAEKYIKFLKNRGNANRKPKAFDFFYNARIVFIDEISMIKRTLMTKLDRILRTIRNTDVPYGGVKIVQSGDFMQIPPVQKYDEQDLSLLGSQIDKRVPILRFILCRSYRQADGSEFLNLLNNLRFKRLTPYDTALLRSRVGLKTELEIAGTKLHHVELHTHNEQVDRVNSDKLLKLEPNASLGPMHWVNLKAFRPKFFYRPRDDMIMSPSDASDCQHIMKNRDQLTKLFPVNNLTCAVGAQVILKCTAYMDLGLCNGSIGVVSDIKPDVIEVIFYDEKTHEAKEPVQVKRYDFKVAVGKTAEIVCRQFPFKIGYAITFHSAQGLTLTRGKMDGSRSFTPGQFYTGLSRFTDLSGVVLNTFDPSSVLVSPIASMYEDVEEDPDLPAEKAEIELGVIE